MTDQERIEQLVRENWGLVGFIYQRVMNLMGGVDDPAELLGRGNEGLFLAARTYDEQRGPFSTYAGHVIYHQMLRYFTFQSRQKRSAMKTVSLHGRIRPRALARLEAHFVDDVLDRLTLRQLLKALSSKERQIICLRYGLGMTYQEVAKKMGASLPAVKKAGQRAIQKMKLEYIRGLAI